MAPFRFARTDAATDRRAVDTHLRRWDEHARAIYRYCFRRTADSALAEDLTSIVFLEAWRRVHEVAIAETHERAWLYGIATNVLRNQYRRQRRHRAALARLPRPPAESDFSERVVERLDDEQTMRSILASLNGLPERDREVLGLCVWEGLTPSEAAVALGVPEATVRTRLHRARRRLRELADRRARHARIRRPSRRRHAMSPDLLDPPAPELPERQLARRRAHLRSEIERPPVAAGRGRGPRIAAAVLVVALVAALAAVLPGRLANDRVGLVAQALAAIGNRPTIHVVLAFERKPELVDLRTGKIATIDSRVELWSDPKLGLVYVRTYDGRLTEQARVRAAPYTANPLQSWADFVAGYRAQLRKGTYHVIGSGTVSGEPVEWIAGPKLTLMNRTTEVEEVAISRSTYKPLYLRWRIDGKIDPAQSTRVLIAETLPRDRAIFADRRTVGGGSTVLPNTGRGSPRMTLRAARAAMNPDPVVPPSTLGGIRRTRISEPPLLIAPGTSYLDQVPGVTFYYGRLDRYSLPAYTGSFFAVTEVADAHYAHALWGPGLFRAGYAVVSPGTLGRASATLETHGLFVSIQASSRERAIAAARLLAR